MPDCELRLDAPMHVVSGGHVVARRRRRGRNAPFRPGPRAGCIASGRSRSPVTTL